MSAASSREGLVELRDGRRLAYADHGVSSGRPCLFFHGIPGSRRQPELIADEARAAGLRVIGVDRPGFGGSTYQPGRRFLDWPADVAALAAALELDRFAVVGISGGSAYALACAVTLPASLSAVVLLSGMGPLDDPAVGPMLPRFSRSMRLGVRLARIAPRVALRLLARQVARDSALTDPLARWAAMMSPADRALLARPGVATALRADIAESVCQGPVGMAWDLALYARPWGFRIGDVPVPVLLWHGDDDWNVPAEFGRGLARALPNCRAHFWPGEGHLAAISHAGEISQALSATISA
ncbi:MAG TPA: alpha/beta hydrolase [Thermomicrobiaceae bacterium]|nr:alpha/beta hydrolase [Thermomicrobiaceae bacterium]